MKKNNQIPVLLGFLGVLLAAVVFFAVYRPYVEKAEGLEVENVVLLQSLNKYKEVSEKEVFYKEATVSMDLETRKIISKYASGLIREDQIMYMANLGNRFSGDLRVNFFNMGTDTEIIYGGTEQIVASPIEQTGDATVANAMYFQEPKTTDNGVHLFQNAMDAGFEVSYEGIKDILDYVNKLGFEKNVTSISLTFDSTSGLLSGTMGLNQYFMTGTDGVYSPTSVPAVQMGLENIFGTIDVSSDDETVEE